MFINYDLLIVIWENKTLMFRSYTVNILRKSYLKINRVGLHESPEHDDNLI